MWRFNYSLFQGRLRFAQDDCNYGPGVKEKFCGTQWVVTLCSKKFFTCLFLYNLKTIKAFMLK